MKIIITIISVLVLAFFLVFLIVTKGKGTYKLSGIYKYSNTLEESKERGVLIKKMDYIVLPDSIKVKENVCFFIEKGFKYGEWSANSTDTSNIKVTFKYQLGIEYSDNNKKIFEKKYTIFQNKLNLNFKDKFESIEDTIKYSIYTLRTPPFDSIYKAGELILFDKKV